MKIYNTHKPYLCIDCGAPVGRRVMRCPDCQANAPRGKYPRSAETRQKMRENQLGKKHDWSSGSTRPEVAEKIRAWWTPERREAQSKKLLELNPDARYHGLSSRHAQALVVEAGRCANCGGDGTESHLGVHHKDRDKHNQSPDNLIILCHRCHMQEHAEQGETGFDAMWRKRKMNQC